MREKREEDFALQFTSINNFLTFHKVLVLQVIMCFWWRHYFIFRFRMSVVS